jgi:hypothetical protein
MIIYLIHLFAEKWGRLLCLYRQSLLFRTTAYTKGSTPQNTGQEFDGSDSGARPDEAVSWGKIRVGAESVKVCLSRRLDMRQW